MRVTEVLVGEFGGDETVWQRLPSATGLPVLARVTGTMNNQACVGAAAMTLGPIARSPWNTPNTAAAIRAGAERLLSREITQQEVLEQLVSPPLIDIPDEMNRVEYDAMRAVRGALEAALLDMVARASDDSIASLLGVVRSEPKASSRTIPAASSRLEEQLEAAVNRFPVIRLRTSRDVATDLKAIQLAALAGQRSGLRRSVWLECAGRYAPGDAHALARAIGELFETGDLRAPVYLEQPMSRRRTGELIELIHETRSVPGQIQVLIDESIRTAEDLAPFLDAGALPGVVVDLRDGVGDVMQIVKRMHESAPSALVALVNTGSTDLERGLAQQLARVLPRLDLYLPGRVTVQLAEVGEKGKGHGLRLSTDELTRTIGRRFLARPSDDGAVRKYEVPGTEVFGKNTLDNYLLEVEARRLGLATTRFRNVSFHAEDESGSTLGFHCSSGPTTTRYGIQVAGDKHVTKTLLDVGGVPTPAGDFFLPGQRTAAVEYARHLGARVVVKPIAGKGGTQVHTDLSTAEEIGHAVDAVFGAGHPAALVEEQVYGRDYRFFVVGDDVVSVVERRGARVVGDGSSSIAQLVIAENAKRQDNPHLRSRPLLIGGQTIDLLAQQDLDHNSVPSVGELVLLSGAANLGIGGHAEEVLDKTHPQLCDLARRAARATPGLGHVGVDVLAPDHRGAEGVVCEVNAFPGLGAHHYPSYGPPRRVAAALIRHYAGRAGIAVPPPNDEAEVEMLITGVVQGVGYRAWFRRLAESLGLTGTVANTDRSDLVRAEVAGHVEPVTALAVQAWMGPRRARVDLVRTRPVEVADREGFELVDWSSDPYWRSPASPAS